MKTNIISLVRLAKLVRNQVEIFVENEEGPTNLGGYCGIASYSLLKRAESFGLNCNLVYGTFRQYNRVLDRYFHHSGHVWVECEDRIIDITATQFSKVRSKIKRNFDQKVYVCSNTNPHYDVYSKNEEAIEEIETWFDETLDELENEVANIAVSNRMHQTIPQPPRSPVPLSISS